MWMVPTWCREERNTSWDGSVQKMGSITRVPVSIWRVFLDRVTVEPTPIFDTIKLVKRCTLTCKRINQFLYNYCNVRDVNLNVHTSIGIFPK